MKMRWDFETEYLLLKRILDRIDGMVTALCGCHVGPNINVYEESLKHIQTDILSFQEVFHVLFFFE
jgi:hypothetical protein